MKLTTPFSVLQWLDQLRRLQAAGKCNGPEFMRPFHLATLALVLASRAQRLVIPKPLETYAARMNLWPAIGLESPIAVAPYVPEGKFLPLQRLEAEDNINGIAAALADIVAKFGADADTRDAVLVSMMEIMGNCFAHAAVAAPLKALVCAQSWPGGNLAQIALADCGIGIRSSLTENPLLRGQLEVGNSCEIATQLGVTSKPQKGHAGYGLALTRQLLERAGGRLIVVSGNEWMQARSLRVSSGTVEAGWGGTLAVLEWRTDFPLRLKDVYESWPLPQGFDHDDFDF